MTDQREVALSQIDPSRRAEMLRAYERGVYAPAFPDPSLREDPAYWLHLLDERPAPPQPLIEVVLLPGDAGEPVVGPVAGVTVELYRASGCGLLTYMAVRADQRGKGLGRRLVTLAREHLGRMASARAPMFAETERLEDAASSAAREETIVRQHRLRALGAREVRFDYVMPPLRADAHTHRLHLLLFDPARTMREIAAATVLVLLEELATALGTSLDRHDDTRQMQQWLRSADMLAIGDLELPTVEPGRQDR